MANDKEREGYVPNVVYSCGSIIHHNELIIPYAMSDYSSGFASIPLDELFEKMFPGGNHVRKTKPVKKDNILRILLVDDDPIEQKILTAILEKEGYEIVAASDGLHALVQLGKYHIDMVLSDIEMPNLTGYQLLEFLKSKNVDIPVVFLTGHTSQEEEIQGLKMGAVDYLKKPVQPDLLKIKLKNLFNNH
jgi:CheY-like chemotaxis protein